MIRISQYKKKKKTNYTTKKKFVNNELVVNFSRLIIDCWQKRATDLQSTSEKKKSNVKVYKSIY